jgi:aminoglycoside phosphotransferase (APT) family kinase protein
MAVRLPRIEWAIGQVEKEQQWLPRLARHLPLAIPVPLAMGTPGEGYPWHWSVYPWLEGETANVERLGDLRQAANELAQFIVALRTIDAAHGPTPGAHNFFRGVPLAARDASTRAAISSLKGLLDVDEVTSAWNAAVEMPAWDAPPLWIHGDLQARNLLVQQGRLCAVIDFGGLSVGDPACDLMIAWSLFSGDSRRAFRAALAVDDATWARGRGWALSMALIALPYYRSTNPVIVAEATHAINEVLADQKAKRT